MAHTEATAGWKQWAGLVVDATFYLDKYLGGTGRSAVYLTDWGEADAKPAAIKLIAADSENAELHLSRWKMASGLSHPHLLKIYQAGRCELDGLRLLYVVMEYAGENLSEILLERPLSEVEAHAMLSGVLPALASLHRQGLVHGRLKPSNIMAVGDQLKISSDSIEKAASPALPAGTYDSPEAARHEVSASADCWSLGATLVEALTQKRPAWNGGEGLEPALPPAMPAPLREVAQHCLLPDPQRRWTVADIENCLAPRRAQVPQPETSQPASLPMTIEAAVAGAEAPARPFRAVSKSYLPMALAGALMLAAAVAVFTVWPSRSQQNQDVASSVSAAPSVQTEQPGRSPELTGDRQSMAVRSSAPDGAEAHRSARRMPSHLPSPRPDAMAASFSDAFVPGAAVEQPMPSIPRKAQRTIHGRVKIKVKVAVDPSGNVANATLASRASSKYFAGIAMDTARHWRFTPAQMQGQNVASEWMLKFEFRRAGTRIHPTALPAASAYMSEPM